MNTLNEIRDLLNRYPEYGVERKGDFSKYYPEKRCLSLEDAAKRMILVNEFLGFKFKENTEEEWAEEIQRILRLLAEDPNCFKPEQMQRGIFKFFLDKNNPGAIRIFADIGTLMDTRTDLRFIPRSGQVV